MHAGARRLAESRARPYARSIRYGHLATIGLAVGALVASACSALIDRADSQCSSDGDCARFGAFACLQGGCVPATSATEAGADAAAGPCTTTAECLAAHDGANWICRHADQTCVSLVSPDCPTVLGQYTSDDVVLLGALLPLYGPHASTGAALSDALRLGVNDFAGGIPAAGGGAARPLAVMLCNESTDVDRAATHLLDDLLVSGIVGTGDSATTLGVAHDVTLPGGAFLISPRATADLSSVSGGGLVWRTCPSVELEGDAIVALAQAVVLPAVIAANQLTTVRVALVHASDVDSSELDTAITTALHMNGALATDPSNAGSFLHVDYGDPDDIADVDAAATMASAVDAVTVTGSLPDVILLVGSTQAVTDVLAGIEAAWPVGARRPQYVVSSGLETTELLMLVDGNDSLRTRILGTAPGGNGANVDAFYGRYVGTFADGTAPQIFGVAQAYDALYALAFAEAATSKAAPLGADLADALRLLVATGDGAAAVPVDVGPDGLAAAFAAIAAGQSLALNGASAPLDFEPTTGGVITDVQVWCMVPGSTPGPIVFQRSGLSYGASSGALEGAIGASCGQ
jgi:hypothetical protein